MDLDLKERLERMSIPEPNSGCWLWLGSLSDTGYGRINVNGVAKSSHRASYEAHCGAIPQGILVLHKCDTRACINPDHLFLGTHKDNAVDMSHKRRGNLNKASREDRIEWARKSAALLGADGRRAKALKISAKMTPEQIRDRSVRGGRALVDRVRKMTPEERQAWLDKRRSCMRSAIAAAASASPQAKSERALKGWATRRKRVRHAITMRINLLRSY